MSFLRVKSTVDKNTLQSTSFKQIVHGYDLESSVLYKTLSRELGKCELRCNKMKMRSMPCTQSQPRWFISPEKKNGNLHKDQKECQRLRHVTVDRPFPHSCGNRMHSPRWVALCLQTGHRHGHRMKVSSLLSCSPKVEATPWYVIRKQIQKCSPEWHQSKLWFEKHKYSVKGRAGPENLNSGHWDLLMCHRRPLLPILQLGKLWY